MKKIIISLMLFSFTNMYATGFYAKGFGGVNFTNKKSAKTGYITGGSLGYQFDQKICFIDDVEVEYAYRYNPIENGHVDFHSMMANLIQEPLREVYSPIQPYWGAGIGAAGVNNIANSDFCYQGLAGIKVPITSNLSISTDYRYFSTVHNTVQSHSVAANLNYTF